MSSPSVVTKSVKPGLHMVITIDDYVKDAVFTMILCVTNVSTWQALELILTN